MHAHRIERHGDAGDVAPVMRSRGERIALFRELANDPGTDECVSPFGPSDQLCTVKLDRKNLPGARAVWALANGDPGQMFVLHTCGNGHLGCLNIRHLYLGDHAQNMTDRNARDGRAARKLTPDAVRAIRAASKAGQSNLTIAIEHGIDRSNVSRIVNRKSWGWLD